MKHLILISFFYGVSLFGQTDQLVVSYKFDNNGDAIANLVPDRGTQYDDSRFSESLNIFYLQIDEPNTSNKKFAIFNADGQIIVGSEMQDDANFHEINFGRDINAELLTIAEIDIENQKVPGGLSLNFRMDYNESTFQEPAVITPTSTVIPPANNGSTSSLVLVSYTDIYAKANALAASFTRTKLGYEDIDGRIHLFFDQFGNSILSVTPQGAPSREYVTHIFYIENPSATEFSYNIKQTKGSFYSGLLLENTETKDLELQSLNSKSRWFTNTTVLRSSNKDDIEFDITKTDYNTGIKKTIESYTINMTPSYNATFNVGILNSQLRNPDYKMVNLNDSVMTVKRSNGGPRGVVAVTATLYASPIILLERLFQSAEGKRQRELQAKSFSRNYFDDHRWYERIFPTVGVLLGENTLENFFIGGNFEFARGASFFFGGALWQNKHI